VGNVLNSVNISAALIADQLRRLRIADLCRATDLLRQHAHDLPDYIGADERGRHLPAFLIELGRHMAQEEERLAEEARSLSKYVEHIKGIVAVQQSYAGISGVVETASLADLLEDAIRINQASMERHGVEVAREFDNLPPALVDRQKFLQIVVNLVSNAYHAVRQAGVKPGRIHVRMRRTEDDSVRIDVIDNGVGISPENLTRVFAHGFTTRKDGHGFGLHSSALYAQDMGGRLTAKSAGCGCGAEFTLELPLRGAGLSPCRPIDEPTTTLSSPIAAS
jgi:signal transduction histidine kinase